MIGPDPYSFRELWRQYRRCRRNKRNTMNALAFEIDAEAHLLTLQRELREHTYTPGRSVCFITDGPKPREVFAAEELSVEELSRRAGPGSHATRSRPGRVSSASGASVGCPSGT